MFRGRKDKHNELFREAECRERIIRAQYCWPNVPKGTIDPQLRELVEGMLRYKLSERIGADITLAEPDANGVLQNTQIREHEFMRRFPWTRMQERTLPVSGYSTI